MPHIPGICHLNPFEVLGLLALQRLHQVSLKGCCFKRYGSDNEKRQEGWNHSKVLLRVKVFKRIQGKFPSST